MRVVDAGTAAIEDQAVIGAADRVALDAAQAERREAMRALIGQRGRLARTIAEQDDRLFQESARDRRVLQVFGPARGIPRITQKRHCHSPTFVLVNSALCSSARQDISRDS
jgi:hypothetical protein